MVQGSIDPSLNQIGAWNQYGYKALIDWVQDLDTTGFETPVHGGGPRSMIGVRRDGNATVSRPYFHDDNCDDGDYRPGDELMVKQVSQPDGTTCRFTLAAGFSAAIVGALVDGTTKISVRLSSTYGDLATNANVDGIYTVKAHSAGAGTIDVDSTGISGVVATFTTFQFFPIFVQGYHDFQCTLQPNYLSPKGLNNWMLVRFMHLLIKPVRKLLGAGVPTATAQWEANHQQSAVVASKPFSVYPLNTRETTTQIVLDIPSPQSEAEAQAVRPTLTYNQLGGRWTVFSMTHFYDPRGSDEVKYYQQ